MKLVPKKPNIVTKGPRHQENCKSKKRENSGIVEVESMFAAWRRIPMRTFQPEVMNHCPLPASVEAFLLQGSGSSWCVVHCRLLPTHRTGWVCLQFQTGQTWVPKDDFSLLVTSMYFPIPRSGR
ncbi:hypothetical protein A6R68_15317 [Neotoma lepida]|uniref:Uncharacterized protein n=1 Tax=Neotoma lepida TaxID=56216 RepID=A0A1A6H959_NEOLE|nr:hypothetical protein A6R68_15317 [Neotoma lepida]